VRHLVHDHVAELVGEGESLPFRGSPAVEQHDWVFARWASADCV
jgi:hypothetical protein